MQRVLEIVYVEPDQVLVIDQILERMPRWHGTLEDATVAVIAEARAVPVWTLNYRDLRAFPNLQFWTPG